MFLFTILLFISYPLSAMEPAKKPRTHMSKDETIEALTQNTNFMIRSLFDSVDTVSIVSEPDVVLVCSDIPNESFNYVLETHFTSQTAQARISEVAQQYKEKNVPWTWWFGPGDTPENLEEYLAVSELFTSNEEAEGMYCPLDQKLDAPSAALDVKRVRDHALLKDFYAINDSHYFEDVWSKISPRYFQDDSPLEFYVGYVEGNPVSAGLITFHANVGGIYSVATVENQRRKGYATTLIQFFLQRIKERGYHYAVLASMPDSKNLYKKFGFQECCTLRGWVKQ